MSLDEAKDNDKELVEDGIEFVVDDNTYSQFGSVVVDFSSGFLGKRFMVNYVGGGTSASC